MASIKNTQPGPRGVNAVDGPLVILPGETVEVDMIEGELAAAEATGWFEIVVEADVEVDDDGLEKNTVAELTELAAAEAIDLGDAKLKAHIIAAIRAARLPKEA